MGRLGLGLQYLLVAFALAYWFISLLLIRGFRGLAADIASAEANGTGGRTGSDSYFYQHLRFRHNPGAAGAIWIVLLVVAAVGLLTVYVLAENLLNLGIVLVQGYLVYVNIDFVEAFLFSRYFARVQSAAVGGWELAQAHWAANVLRRSRFIFLLLGLAMFLASFVAAQLVASVEIIYAYYAGAVFSASTAVPAPLSFVLVVGTYSLSTCGIVWAGHWVAKAVRAGTGSRPSP